MNTVGQPTAASVSRALAQQGVRALGSGTPRWREGVRVLAGLGHTTVEVSIDSAITAARVAADVAEALTAARFVYRAVAPGRYWVTGRSAR